MREAPIFVKDSPYEQYYNMIEKLEDIGFKIWKMFGDLWKEEKQSLIIKCGMFSNG
jgi:hypothetical protein